MDALLFEEDTSMYPSSAPPPAKRSRNHRRAATEGNFDFLYEQQKQEQKQQRRVSSVDHDPFGLGPAAPAKPDLLNAIAHSFVKEQQHRILNRSANLGPGQTGPTLIHSESLSTRSSATPAHLDDLAPSPAPQVSPPTPACTIPPAFVFASEDEMMDLAMAVEPVPAPGPNPEPPPQIGMDVDIHHVNPNPSTYVPEQTTTNWEGHQSAPARTLGTDQPMQADGDQSEPSRLSRFLDSLQVMADQQNAMFQEQLRQQQQRYSQQSNAPAPAGQPRGHRRAVSEGPTHFDLTYQQQQQQPLEQNWPSFEMSDRTEEAAIFMANQNRDTGFY